MCDDSSTSEENTMLTFQDCADYCDLYDDEIQAITTGANISPIEVCALVQQHADSPKECRKMLKFLTDYLEKAEPNSDEKRSHEIHEAINHFVSNHKLV
jgi:hypothetical protein